MGAMPSDIFAARTDALTDAIEAAKANFGAITWDGCHKIYIYLDAEQAREWMFSHGEHLGPASDTAQALATLRRWFGASCGLRFIQTVVSPGDNGDFTNIINQFDEAC